MSFGLFKLALFSLIPNLNPAQAQTLGSSPSCLTSVQQEKQAPKELDCFLIVYSKINNSGTCQHKGYKAFFIMQRKGCLSLVHGSNFRFRSTLLTFIFVLLSFDHGLRTPFLTNDLLFQKSCNILHPRNSNKIYHQNHQF